MTYYGVISLGMIGVSFLKLWISVCFNCCSDKTAVLPVQPDSNMAIPIPVDVPENAVQALDHKRGA